MGRDSVAAERTPAGGSRIRQPSEAPASEKPGAIRWLLEWFVVLSAWLVAGGWILSAAKCLNTAGYIIWLTAFAGAGFAAVRTGLLLPSPGFFWRQFRWPRRWAARIFACLLLATLVGGVSHGIVHFDTLSYRIPRILQYLAENRWHWIRTTEFRMNAVSPGIEWLWSPIFALKGSERLVNALGSLYYLFLPGLLFGVWTQSGISRRTAWWWSWILPAGYCYAMQAGGPATDLPGTIYTLAAIDMVLRAWRCRSWRHLCLSVLAISLMGTLRLMCLPLGLVWAAPAVAAFLRKHPPRAAALGTTVLALACSFIPGGYFNIKYAGSFRGIPTDAYPAIKHPLLAIVPNFIWFLFQNLVPPFFPWYMEWNRWATSVTSAMGERFAGLPFWGTVERGASEQNAGLGCTVFLFALVSIVLARKYRQAPPVQRDLMTRWIWATPWIALTVFAAQIGLAQSGRYLASYYPLLLAPFLASPGFSTLVRRAVWQRTAATIIVLSLLLVVISRQRPLWPIDTLAKTLARQMPGNPLLKKVGESFDRSGNRTVLDRFISENLPRNEIAVGYFAAAGVADLDLAGDTYSRRVWRLDGTESAEWLRSRNIRYVLFEEWNPNSPDHPSSSQQWHLKLGGGKEIARLPWIYALGDRADIVLLDLGAKQ